jgi:predicted nucleic acid-binding protein
VIFVDSNLFVIDLRYLDDPDHRVNRRALDRLARDGTGMTSVLNVLETCGILSFNLSVAALHALYVHFAQRYRVTVVPGGGYDTRLPAPTVREVLARMEKRMALKDAEIAHVAEQHAASLSAFVSWNAKHFAGKLSVPALTPREWLRRGRVRRKRP